MYEKDISRIGFAAGRDLKEQRDTSVCIGMFGQVIIDDQDVFSLIGKKLCDGSP